MKLSGHNKTCRLGFLLLGSVNVIVFSQGHDTSVYTWWLAIVQQTIAHMSIGSDTPWFLESPLSLACRNRLKDPVVYVVSGVEGLLMTAAGSQNPAGCSM